MNNIDVETNADNVEKLCNKKRESFRLHYLRKQGENGNSSMTTNDRNIDIYQKKVTTI